MLAATFYLARTYCLNRNYDELLRKQKIYKIISAGLREAEILIGDIHVSLDNDSDAIEALIKLTN